MSFGGVTHPHMVNGKGTSAAGKCNEADEFEEMPNVCRQLFASVSGKGESGYSSRALEEVMLEQKRRWNFDFETETPLPGRYQWVRVQRPGPLLNGNCDHTRNDTDPDPVQRTVQQSHSDARAPPARSQNFTHEGGGAGVDVKQAQVTQYLRKGKYRSFKADKIKGSEDFRSELKQMVSSTLSSHKHQK